MYLQLQGSAVKLRQSFGMMLQVLYVTHILLLHTITITTANETFKLIHSNGDVLTTGEQTRDIKCTRTSDGSEVRLDLCDHAKKLSGKRDCNTHPCEAK